MNALAWFTPERLSVLSRVLAAAAGGYLIANLATFAFTFLLPVEPYKALLFGMQVSFVIYTLAIVWAFAARTATRVWCGLLLVGGPLLLIDLGFYYFVARLVV